VPLRDSQEDRDFLRCPCVGLLDLACFTAADPLDESSNSVRGIAA
jgi:hypothetical protein